MTAGISPLGQQEFVNRFGEVFEHSRWIADEVWKTGLNQKHESPAGLTEAFSEVILASSDEQKLALLRAHPNLAVAVDKKAQLTSASQSEQKGAGLDRCTADEYAEFRSLNLRYPEKFGFPFILAVKGYHRIEILKIFQARLANTKGQEFQTALEQVIRIGRFRIESLFEMQA